MRITQKRKRDSFLPSLQVVVDSALIFWLLERTFWLRFRSGYFHHILSPDDFRFYIKPYYVIVLAVVFFLRFYDLYKPLRMLTFVAEAGKVIKAVAASTVILTALTFFVRDFSYSRTFLLMAGVVLAMGLSLERYVFGLIVMGFDRWRGSYRNLLIVGCDENARRLAQFYRKNPRFSTRVIGFLDDTRPLGDNVDSVPVLGRTADTGTYIQQHHEVHEVVLALPDIENEKVLRIIHDCEKEMVAFRWIADIFGLITSRMSVSYLGGVPLLSFTESPLMDWENRFLKRGMDIGVSLIALAVLSPLLGLIALLIKTDSRGPMFYGQERVGEDGRRFMLYKFRTMSTDAEDKTGPVWAVKDDPRRTRVGTLLRLSSADELPQLWNVLKGDMSLVGPRPERPFFVSQFKEDIPRYMARHAIRSGITGWAQVNGLRGNTSIEERTKFDLYYIENWSLFLDLKILFMTLFSIAVSRHNAY